MLLRIQAQREEVLASIDALVAGELDQWAGDPQRSSRPRDRQNVAPDGPQSGLEEKKQADASPRGESQSLDSKSAAADASNEIKPAAAEGSRASSARRGLLLPARDLRGAQARLLEVEGFSFLLRAQEQCRQGQETSSDVSPDPEAKMPGQGGDILAALSEIEALERSFEAARHGEVLSLFELLGVRALLWAAGILRRVWSMANGESMRAWRESTRGLLEDSEKGLKALARALGGRAAAIWEGDDEFLRELVRCIDFNEQGDIQIADAASPALASARKELRGAKINLERQAKRLLAGGQFESGLQDRFWTEREGRVVIPLRSDAMGRFGEEAIVHGSSQRGRTLFVEPRELVGANNALRAIRAKIIEEELRIQQELSAQAVAKMRPLLSMQRSLFALDAIAARFELGELWSGEAPQLVAPPKVKRERPPHKRSQDAVEGQSQSQDAEAGVAKDAEGAGDEGQESSSPAASEEETAPTRIVLPNARHPLMLLDGVEVVPNDIELDCGAALIISGPNAGGKTVALKTLGLCVLLARAGVRIPAQAGAILPAFSHIVTDVGDDQSISANLSTFSAHMEHVKEALASARHRGEQSLVLFDEIAVGTDPEQGAALAEAIVRRLVQARVTVVVTTHYERLKRLGSRNDPRYVNASVGFDLQALRPTFLLHFGLPGSSSAIEVARRLGVDPGVLSQAEQFLGQQRRRSDELLREIEAERVSIEKLKLELEHRLDGVARREKKLELREAKAIKSAHQRRQKAIEAATDELFALEKDLKTKRKQLRKIGADPDLAPTRDQVTKGPRQTVDKSKERARRDAARIDGSPRKVAPVRELAVGDRVRVRTLGEEGEVISIRGHRVTVQLPLLKTTVSRKELQQSEAPPETGRVKSNPGAPIHDWSKRGDTSNTAARHFGESPVAVSQSIDNRCDLRGARVEDAFDAVEKFLDRALQSGQEVVVIVHGHGSGELRKGLRAHLGRLGHVRRQRPGILPEGGDGVTVAWLG